ncbi:MAG: TonB-dependent receptor [Candidatus Eisenbacteria sp.]|nr:TonB-dependent receptor [Candidatus Eisenbacteria bacterium]
MSRAIYMWSPIVCLVLGLALLAPTPACAAVGKIAGIISDAESGDPLAYANVIVLDTQLGAASRADGKYLISAVPEGTYTLKIMMMGYQDGIKENVRVEPNRTTVVDFQLGMTVFENLIPTVEVVEERKDIHLEESGSVKTIDVDDIKVRSIDTVEEAIATTAGVTFHGGQIHVRGGRSSEVKYYVDGTQVTDPFVGGTSLDLSLASVSDINVLSGGFDAEYGNAQSGIINFVTKEGGNNYSGMLKFMTDDFGAPDKTYFNTDNVLVGFGGPLWGRNLFFYLSGEATWSDTYNNAHEYRNRYDLGPITISDRQQNSYSGQAKFTYFFSPTKKMGAEYLFSKNRFDTYDHAFSRTGYWSPEREEWWPWAKDSTYTYFAGPEHTPNVEQLHETYKLSWRHTLSAATFYTARASYFISLEERKVKDKNPWEYNPVFFSSDNYLDPMNRFFVIRGDSPLWRRYRTGMLSMRADLTSQVSRSHQVRTGFIGNYYDLDMFEAMYPSRTEPNGIYHDKYHLYSWGGALYFQDKMRYEGMIVNAGIRWDFYDPGRTAVINASMRRTVLMEGAHKATIGSRLVQQLSPRLGMAYPISDRQVLHFHYGRFYEIPPLSYLYEYNGQAVTSGGTIIGNVFLRPQTTIAYEMGLEHQLTRNLSLDATIFYKDIFGLVGTDMETNQESSSSRIAHTYFNKDYGSVRGFELSLNKRFSRRFAGSLSYTYCQATGSSSSERLGYQVALENFTREPITELPLDWDQTQVVSANIYLAEPGVWGMNMDFEYATGVPYTPRELKDKEIEAEQINSARLPSTVEINLKADKRMKIYGQEFSFFLEGRNILDQKNIWLLAPGRQNGNYQAAYTMEGIEGGAYNLADVVESSEDRLIPLHDPETYYPGRRFKVGISVDW